MFHDAFSILTAWAEEMKNKEKNNLSPQGNIAYLGKQNKHGRPRNQPDRDGSPASRSTAHAAASSARYRRNSFMP